MVFQFLYLNLAVFMMNSLNLILVARVFNFLNPVPAIRTFNVLNLILSVMEIASLKSTFILSLLEIN